MSGADWHGNSVIVAEKHYLQTLDSHFESAAGGGERGGAIDAKSPVQLPVPHCMARMGKNDPKQQKIPANTGAMLSGATCGELLRNYKIPSRGVGQPEQSTGKGAIPDEGGARGGAVAASAAGIDVDLQAIIDAWPALPPATVPLKSTQF